MSEFSNHSVLIERSKRTGWISLKKSIKHISRCRQLKNLTHFTLRGHELSPVKHIYLKNINLQRPEKFELLEKFVDKVKITLFSFLWLTVSMDMKIPGYESLPNECSCFNID